MVARGTANKVIGVMLATLGVPACGWALLAGAMVGLEVWFGPGPEILIHGPLGLSVEHFFVVGAGVFWIGAALVAGAIHLLSSSHRDR